MIENEMKELSSNEKIDSKDFKNQNVCILNPKQKN